MASNILLENKKTRNTVELEDIPETFEEFDNFVKENFFKDPSDNLSYEYSDAQGEMNILTEANYDKRVLQEILDSDKPKIVVIDDDDSSDEEDDKEVNLDTLSFAKSLVSNKSNISEKKPNEEKKENDSKKNEVPETKITDNKKPDDNKPNDDKDKEDDDEDDLFNVKISESFVTAKKQTKIEKKEEIKNDEKDKKIEDLEKKLKEKDDELKKKVEEYEEIIKKKDKQIKKYENKTKKMEKIFEDILASMNEKLNEEINKKLDNKINKINQYYEEKLKQKKE